MVGTTCGEDVRLRRGKSHEGPPSGYETTKKVLRWVLKTGGVGAVRCDLSHEGETGRMEDKKGVNSVRQC